MSILENCKQELLKQEDKKVTNRHIELELSKLDMIKFINEINSLEVISDANNIAGFHFNNIFISNFGFIKFEHNKDLLEGYKIKVK